MKSKVEKYLNIPYRRVVYREENADGIYWVAEIEELGVAADGETPEEALHELELYLPTFFQAAIEDSANLAFPSLWLRKFWD